MADEASIVSGETRIMAHEAQVMTNEGRSATDQAGVVTGEAWFVADEGSFVGNLVRVVEKETSLSKRKLPFGNSRPDFPQTKFPFGQENLLSQNQA
jgi:hypothetical protein